MNIAPETGITLLDIVALFWFAGSWIAYIHYTKYKSLKQNKGLLAAMNCKREVWALAVLERDNRIMDSQIISALMRKESFFASTTMLILASSIALIGMGDEVLRFFRDIPSAQTTSRVLWELKVAVLVIVFMYAFFKFTWAIRQHSYCATLLGAMPEHDKSDTLEAKKEATRLAELSSLAANHFNDGLRAYYFALAELCWFFHPLAFMLATTWVIFILFRREYRSRALAILS